MILITKDAIDQKLRREGVIGRKLRREGVNGRKLRREGVNGTPLGGASTSVTTITSINYMALEFDYGET